MKLRKDHASYFLRLPKNIINLLQIRRSARAFIEMSISKTLSEDNHNYINNYMLSMHIEKRGFDFGEVRSTLRVNVPIRYVKKMNLVEGMEIFETLLSNTGTAINLDLEISSKIPKEKHFLTPLDNKCPKISQPIATAAPEMLKASGEFSDFTNQGGES